MGTVPHPVLDAHVPSVAAASPLSPLVLRTQTSQILPGPCGGHGFFPQNLQRPALLNLGVKESLYWKTPLENHSGAVNSRHMDLDMVQEVQEAPPGTRSDQRKHQ